MPYFTYFALLYFILDFENKDPISKSTRIPTTEISLFHLLPERRVIWIFTLLQSVNLLLSNSVSAKTYENVNPRRSQLSQDTRNINYLLLIDRHMFTNEFSKVPVNQPDYYQRIRKRVLEDFYKPSVDTNINQPFKQSINLFNQMLFDGILLINLLLVPVWITN